MSQLTLSLPDAWSSITSSPWALAGTALGVVALSYVLTRPGKQCVAVSHALLDAIAMIPWHCLQQPGQLNRIIM